MRRVVLMLCVSAAMLALAACKEDTGYVEIKVAPGFIVPPLALGAARIDPAKSASTVLRQKVGAASIWVTTGREYLPLFCKAAMAASACAFCSAVW